MASTENTYTGNGSTVLYAFTFPYLNTTDVKASLNGTATTAYTFANETTVQFNSAPGSGVAIRIYRETADTTTPATFYAGSAIRAKDLNDNFTQNLYTTQESNNEASSATTTATTAKTTADSAATNAASAVTTANAASSNATTALSTANTASSNATTALSTANTASTNASNAVTSAGTANTNATNAVNTANTASTNASNAISTANTADTNATNAVSTANSASTSATSAVSTANTASTNATNAVNTANTASTNASAAVATANAASAAVAAAVLYTPKADKAALEGFAPSADGYYEVANSSNLANGTWTYNSVTYTLSGIPATFEGNSGLTVRLAYTHSSKTFAWASYFANDPEDRYLSDTRSIQPTITYVVKVATKNSFHRYNGSGASNGFTIDAQQAPFLEFIPGQTYKFDQSDSSNSGHPLAFYQEADKTTGYSTGVTTSGTPGSAGAYTQIVTSDNNPTVLHYQCSNHAYMGNAIQLNTAFDRTAHQVIDAGNFDNGSSTAALSQTYDGGDFDS